MYLINLKQEVTYAKETTITVLMEAALITPPIGINLYVVHGFRTRGGKFSDVSIGALPFLIGMFALIFILLIIPDLATWLPQQFYGK